MVVTTGPDRARRAGRVRLGVLALVGLLSAHTAIYAAQYGLDDRFAHAMSSAGHDGWWVPASVIVLAIGLIVLLHILGTLTHLEGALRSAGASGRQDREAVRAPFASEVLAIWRRLLPIVLALFLAQENIEYLVAHGRLLGFDALVGSGDPLALPILAAVTIALSCLGALIRWRITTLRARIAVADRRDRSRAVVDAPARRWRVVGDLAPRRWMSVRLDAGRAPPELLRI